MFHENVNDHAHHRDNSIAYKSKLGVKMFFFYLIFYAGFVFINLYDPLLMEKVVFFGLNLAVVYGFVLIIGALIQALIYDALCRLHEKQNADLVEGV